MYSFVTGEGRERGSDSGWRDLMSLRIESVRESFSGM